MTRFVYIIIIALTFLILFQVLPVNSQEEQKHKEWIGTLPDGKILTKNDLRNILADHEKWLDTYAKEGKQVNLKGANLSGADLSRAILIFAVLDGTSLYGADLSRTDLKGANLRGANLTETNLSGAKVLGADLGGAIFEPKLESIPKITDIDYALNLSELTFRDRPKSLVALREEFKKGGMRKQEREVTRAIKHTQMQISWKEDSPLKKIEAAFNYLFFELTCQYGMKPGRALIVLLGFIPLFSFFYIFALKTKRHKTGLWLIFIKERVLKATKKERPFKLTANFPPRTWPEDWTPALILTTRLYRMIRIAIYFSLLSATSIGWREFNIGNWLTRIQRREYTLRATGWVRTISGLQSLISVYLLALWVLTYFGRPFEAV